MMKAKRPTLKEIYQAYIDSESWKCPQSPTEAHHWEFEGKVGYCKYCHEERVQQYEQGGYYFGSYPTRQERQGEAADRAIRELVGGNRNAGS